jgi:hypothetical protein
MSKHARRTSLRTNGRKRRSAFPDLDRSKEAVLIHFDGLSPIRGAALPAGKHLKDGPFGEITPCFPQGDFRPAMAGQSAGCRDTTRWITFGLRPRFSGQWASGSRKSTFYDTESEFPDSELDFCAAESNSPYRPSAGGTLLPLLSPDLR